MKKLNNKGMTSIEVLLAFIVVVMLSVSMYTTISAYQNKQNIESFKEKIMTYKNLLTKEINDDLIDSSKDSSRYYPDGFVPLQYQKDAVIQAKRILENSIKTEKISHSYMFIGQNGIGKFMIAKEFALYKIVEIYKSLNNKLPNGIAI